MSNIFNNPSDFDPSDPENIKVKRIQEDKYTRIIEFKNLKLLSDMIMAYHILQLLEEVTEEYLGKRKEKRKKTETTLTKTLTQFCSKFEVLANHNESRNIHFAQSLSELWHEILHYINDADLLMQPPKHIVPLKSLMKQIFQFPKKTDHSFGYYLNEYAGEKWLPFPFMDLMNSLHEDAILHGHKSILSDWQRSLKLILEPLKDKD